MASISSSLLAANLPRFRPSRIGSSCFSSVTNSSSGDNISVDERTSADRSSSSRPDVRENHGQQQDYSRHDFVDRRNFSNSQSFNILSLDGGGVRGAFTASCLFRLEREVPGFLDRFDLIAGTSTGSVIALCLAKGMPIKGLLDVYMEACPDIFRNPNSHLPYGFGASWFSAKYSNAPLKRHLSQWFGADTTLGELDKKVVLTSFRIDGTASKTHRGQEHTNLRRSSRGVMRNGSGGEIGGSGGGSGGVGKNNEGGAGSSVGNRWRPAVFSNLPVVPGVVGSDEDLPVVDAAMRSAAAPTYFPVYQGYCDGAVTANNPSLVAVSMALAHYPGLRRENIRVLSLGAGSQLKALPDAIDAAVGGGEAAANGRDWGVLQWAPHLVAMLMDSSALSTDLMVGLMLGHRSQYHRLECELAASSGHTFAIDEVKSMKYLAELAWEIDFDHTTAFVKDMARDEPWSYEPLKQDYGPSLIDLPTDSNNRKSTPTFSVRGSSSVTDALYQRSNSKKTHRPAVPETDPEYPDMVVAAWSKAVEKEARETAAAAVAAVAGDGGTSQAAGAASSSSSSSAPLMASDPGTTMEELVAANAFARMSLHQEHIFVDDDGSDDDGPNAHARLRYDLQLEEVDAAWSQVASQLAGVDGVHLKTSQQAPMSTGGTSNQNEPSSDRVPSSLSRVAQAKGRIGDSAKWYPTLDSEVPPKKGWAPYARAKRVK